MREILVRLKALTQKEFRQLFRDKSNLLLGIGLPIILIFIFGYGISFDITGVKVAVIDLERSALSREIVRHIAASPVMSVDPMGNIVEAQKALRTQRVEAIVEIGRTFSRDLSQGQGRIGLITDGKDPNRAQNFEVFITGIASQVLNTKSLEHKGMVVPVARMWFNQTVNSTWYLVPGLIVLIITLVGTFLTSLVMAREWERGTLEAIFVSPVRPFELIIGKIIPYFCVGFLGLMLCMLAADFLFKVPLQGSVLWLYFFSMVYLVITLAIGLLISALTRNQFIASQISVLMSFLPCLMFSDFIFDLRNVPTFISIIGHLLPSTYYLEIIKTLYLAGDYYPLMLRNGVVLLGFAGILIYLTILKTKKTLDR